ncbi:VWA domain-containing protein [Hyunsoonleella sp. SJ7]|uniref:VWA domain-containing protein n=1 Tax=Hyunsoonleella aquatilis TaxID=2762758 RepID=A0A923HBT1_9FLAO|nr:VWA domain-containing protein [Hyunsoonleella aquatilis]MBC3758952.1 VWA domain-containing protein [Hyunsoonleella aquatilis]
MQTETLLYIISSGILALFIALFQYRYKSKHKSSLSIVFTFLRFLTLFALLLLIINPKFEQIKVFTEKPKLVLAVDNSSSVKHLKQSEKALDFVNAIKNNEELKNKFDLEVFTFDRQLINSDSISFSTNETNINSALHQLSEIYKNEVAPMVLLSDGNQTFGSNYGISNQYKHPVYPIILGDTITYTDLKIQQLNVNKYAFSKNRFPVEAILVYQGNEAVEANFFIKQEASTVYSKRISFSKIDNSKVINATLPANRVGVNSYKAILEPLANEKNTVNNAKNFAVEVIDQKTKIALVSDFPHPDLGAFKKSIESNEQRSVNILSPVEAVSKVNDFQLFIIYQPNNKFTPFYETLNKENKNRFTIIGAKSNLSFINNIDNNFTHEITGQDEDYQSKLNLNFSPFMVEDINFESFPPLKSHFGEVSFSVPFETILEKTVLGISNNQPLLATFETNGRREAVLFGENIWQWRAQSYLNEKSFQPFDDFISKLMQYLSSNKKKSRLNVEYESFYNGNVNLVIKAQVFDKSYVFDARQSMEIVLRDNVSEKAQTLPLVLKNNNYQADLSGLPASNYSFSVKTKDGSVSRSGTFEVLEYNIEQQFLNADVTSLQQLATNTDGKAFFVDDAGGLFSELSSDNRFKPIQKSSKNTIPLIDWKYLLAIIAFTLSAEWFLRKYNGLI